MTLERFGARFDATLPRLRELIGLEVFIMVREKALVKSS
jgi:hypothetical protein